jgi:hypothetical protein
MKWKIRKQPEGRNSAEKAESLSKKLMVIVTSVIILAMACSATIANFAMANVASTTSEDASMAAMKGMQEDFNSISTNLMTDAEVIALDEGIATSLA